MTQSYILVEFVNRSTDKPLEETRLNTVLNQMPKLGLEGPWLAGGALRRTICGQVPDSDFDFFFRNEEQLKRFKGRLEDEDNLRLHLENEHQIEFRGTIDDEPVKIQLIRFAYYKTAEQVIDSFDFTICQFVFDGMTLTCGDYSLWDLARKRLAIHKVTYPLSTMRRVLKYTNQGFTACSGCLTALLKAIPDDPKLLEQLHVQYVD